MSTPLMIYRVGDRPVYYRKDTSDLNVLKEVLERRCYRKKKFGFDVEKGEFWLDLGANIGAFGIYCELNSATAECYEPNFELYPLLLRNVPRLSCINSAVTISYESSKEFFGPKNSSKRSRGTFCKASGMVSLGKVYNMSFDDLPKADGAKIDIEGSELEMIDTGKVPNVEKLVMEYHSSRDPNPVNLSKRLKILQDLYKEVSYPPEYDKRIASGEGKTFFDRLIFCKGRK